MAAGRAVGGPGFVRSDGDGTTDSGWRGPWPDAPDTDAPDTDAPGSDAPGADRRGSAPHHTVFFVHVDQAGDLPRARGLAIGFGVSDSQGAVLRAFALPVIDVGEGCPVPEPLVQPVFRFCVRRSRAVPRSPGSVRTARSWLPFLRPLRSAAGEGTGPLRVGRP
ncbi:hypothetical protein [Streptomyces sp. NPDC058872]|uniref:hypothetical protein n=1 Tax=Streptomyces sp. NPDC058872 TaxID=3346661 RepID=UPI0036738383